MGRQKLKLGLPEVAAVIDERYAKEREARNKIRLLAVKLAAGGEHTSAEIAEFCGVARGHLFRWLKALREGGIEGLLQRAKPGPKLGSCRRLSPQVASEMAAKLAAGDFVSAVAAQRWLKEAHGLDRPYQSVWLWLKKAGGVLLVPRPSHSKKDPAAGDEFRHGLAEKLKSLKLPSGSLVKLWMMDEARFGLHTEVRRLWACKGQRPVVTKQLKYQWDYLYGSLDILSGEAHFCHFPSVNLSFDTAYLDNLQQTHPKAIHVIIRDQAGFHLRDGDARLPSRVRIINLPAYWPELNPCEQMWDMIKDEIANRVYPTIRDLRHATLPVLQRFWQEPARVLRLVGRPWLLDQVNAIH